MSYCTDTYTSGTVQYTTVQYSTVWYGTINMQVSTHRDQCTLVGSICIQNVEKNIKNNFNKTRGQNY